METSEDRAYQEFMQRLSACTNFERTTSVAYTSRSFDLEQFRAFLQEMGSPQLSYPSILITGTAGKGSTAEMITRILTATGYRVGLFTSPHVVDIRERIRIGDSQINRTDLITLGFQIMDADHFHNGSKKGSRTFFEVLTAIALQFFHQQCVDIAVIEVGVGGRLDATNVVNPLISIITPVDLDHMHWLGTTRPEIAREKAGIIHPGCTLITSKQRQSVNRVLAGRVKELRVPWLAEGRDFSVTRGCSAAQQGPEMLHFTYSGNRKIRGLGFGSNASYQLGNAAIAITAALTLEGYGFQCEDHHIRQALSTFCFPARFQSLWLRHRPSNITRRMVIDGAHNPLSIRSLLNSMSAQFKTCPIIVVFACARDKDAASMVPLISRVSRQVIVTTFAHYRARPAEDLVQYASGSMTVVKSERPADAIIQAMKLLPPHGIVLVCGSFFLAGDVLTLIGDDAIFERLPGPSPVNIGKLNDRDNDETASP